RSVSGRTTATTEWPASTRLFATLAPMRPVAPVRSTFIAASSGGSPLAVHGQAGTVARVLAPRVRAEVVVEEDGAPAADHLHRLADPGERQVLAEPPHHLVFVRIAARQR